jgi:hypothetical protein
MVGQRTLGVPDDGGEDTLFESPFRCDAGFVASQVQGMGTVHYIIHGLKPELLAQSAGFRAFDSHAQSLEPPGSSRHDCPHELSTDSPPTIRPEEVQTTNAAGGFVCHAQVRVESTDSNDRPLHSGDE